MRINGWYENSNILFSIYPAIMYHACSAVSTLVTQYIPPAPSSPLLHLFFIIIPYICI